MTAAGASGESRTGRRMAWLAALALLAGLTALFQAMQDDGGGMVESVTGDGRAMVILEADRSGHYVAEGTINGQPVVFLVDTGATDVAIPAKAARAVGVELGPEVMVMTAAGPVRAWRARLDRVSVGGITLENVRATVTNAPMEEALLGMSFLKHFNIRQQNGKLIIDSGAGTS